MKASRTIEIKWTFDGSDLVDARLALPQITPGRPVSQEQLAGLMCICRQRIQQWEKSGPHTVWDETKQKLEQAGIVFEKLS